MDIQNFIANFADQFDETDTSTFTQDTKFREIEEWTSLLALSIIAMVDSQYDVELKGDDIRNSETIFDLFNIIKKKQS